jgi:transcriptional regulator with XRE-family HTH domain
MRPPSATAIGKSPEFGDRVRAARDRAHLSQRQLASAVGVDKRAVQGWEAGESGITWPNLKKLADQLDVSADWLRLGDELQDLPAEADARSYTPEQVIDAASQAAVDAIEKLLNPGNGSRATLLDALREIAERLTRIEAQLDDADEAAADPAGDDLVTATRRSKAALGAGRAESDAPASRAGQGTRRASGASSGSARAPGSGTPRSASKRAR